MVSALVRDIDGHKVGQREADHYVNATALCQAGGKRWNDYWRLGTTKDFVVELSAVTGIPATELVQARQGGTPSEQGTWAHPRVATHLAQWISARFAVIVSGWVLEILTTGRVELPGSGTGDPILDMVEQSSRALVAIADVRRRQLDTEREVGVVRAIAERAGAVAPAALQAVECGHGYFTLLAYARRTGREVSLEEAKVHGRQLSALCRRSGVQAQRTPDQRFGYVNAYPESLLREHFGDGDRPL